MSEITTSTTNESSSNNSNNNNSSSSGGGDMTLFQLFTYGQKIYNDLQSSDAPSTSDADYQSSVRSAILYLMKSSLSIDKQSLFSKNEELDDIRTDLLKYLLVPYYLSELFLLLVDTSRLKNLKNAKNKAIQFLQRIETLGIISQDDQQIVTRLTDNTKQSNSQANRRNELVSRGKREKEIKQKLAYVIKKRLDLIKQHGNKDSLDEEVLDCGDEEVEREFAMLLLNEAIIKSVANLEMLDTEMTMLEEIDKMKAANNGVVPKPPPPKPSGIGNFKILPDGRQIMLDKVFRPSHILPTISPEEAAAWEMHNGGMVKGKGGKESEKKGSDDEAEDDGKEENHDKLREKRDWDDWKDDNPRGWGNIKG
ncbi:hypothetical protein PPL_11118 [Heterostelium album PN500]|uniref:TAP42-like protein n=1 Tax=Heterostelium pallidum (strain ATCC 26659 / Pp 5 / PN500) TaxID=670386 RepID=D3BSZ7_HETP5|nr:hypothetical protein PPL_11118 [Heterostelium album PN500]EFA75612.1 hypothetical protein PPL_11118 [Heterostelium album PN500]|eukprot:XP_020427746.1 hypothetical protein PPL_11118 [Heterostelium album PN500]